MAIEQVTGHRPPTCPWRAYLEPIVGEVLDLYRVAQNGSGAHLASLWPMDPPQVVWEGVQLYAQCVARIRDNHDDKAAEARGK